jgi:hypothetical protein
LERDYKVLDFFFELLALGSRDPGIPEPLRLNAENR